MSRWSEERVGHSVWCEPVQRGRLLPVQQLYARHGVKPWQLFLCFTVTDAIIQPIRHADRYPILLSDNLDLKFVHIFVFVHSDRDDYCFTISVDNTYINDERQRQCLDIRITECIAELHRDH